MKGKNMLNTIIVILVVMWLINFILKKRSL